MIQDRTRPRFVQIAVSRAAGAAAAVDEALAGIDLAEACFLLAFVPEGLNLGRVAEALESGAGGVPVFGCTTAGTITTEGYETEALLILAFPREHFRCASMLIEPLKPMTMKSIAADVPMAARASTAVSSPGSTGRAASAAPVMGRWISARSSRS